MKNAPEGVTVKNEKVATSLALEAVKKADGRFQVQGVTFRDGSIWLEPPSKDALPLPMLRELFLVKGPDAQAWLKVADRMDSAIADPAIAGNAHAVAFCKLVQRLALGAGDESTLEDVLEPLKGAAKAIHASDVANVKHAKNRESRLKVLEEWSTMKGEGVSKTDASKRIAAIVPLGQATIRKMLQGQ